MKKIFVFLSLIVLATSCDWFVFDNQEYYNASVEGKITDTKTGQPIQFAFPNTCKISVIEEGWTDKAGNPAEEAQSWYVKCNGVYVNKLVWAAKYRMETKDQNFYPVSIPFELKKGANTVNFEVTPYCRVLDPQITFEDNKIVARFKVEVEDIAKTHRPLGERRQQQLRLRQGPEGGPAEEDQECRRHLRHRAQDRPVQREGKRHAVRLQAHPLSPDRRPRLRRAYGDENTSKRYNFSPVFKVSSDFSKVEEVTNWDED